MKHKDSGCGNVCCTQIEDLAVTVGGNNIIKNINLHIHCGEITAVVGPNGGGKSTLIKAIVGELPYTGTVRYLSADGTDHATSPTIGYVPQTPNFDDGYPVSVQDLFVATTTKYPVWFPIPSRIRKFILQCLSIVEMQEHIDKKIGVLSGGELQRVLLAMALEPIPQLLVLDEPASGIDKDGLKLFYQILDRIRKDFDLTIIIVTHDLGFVKKYADRLVMVGNGTAITGSPDELEKTFGGEI